MRVTGQTSMKRIFQAVQSDLGYDLDTYEILEWAGRALEQCLVKPALKEYVAFAKVENHRTKLPTNLTYIIQLAKNNCYEETPTCPKDVITTIEEPTTQPTPALLDCHGHLINGCDYANYYSFVSWDLPFFSLVNGGHYKECYTPIRLKNHSFFMNVVCTPRDEKLYDGCRDEFTISDRDLILSFPEGQIAIAYKGYFQDEEGYPMFPDHESYVQAILSYIRYKVAYRMYDMEMDRLNMGHVAQKLQKAEQDWHFYCRQAQNLGIMDGGGTELLKDIQTIGDYILPPKTRYESFFGNLTVPQDRISALGAWNTRR